MCAGKLLSEGVWVRPLCEVPRRMLPEDSDAAGIMEMRSPRW